MPGPARSASLLPGMIVEVIARSLVRQSMSGGRRRRTIDRWSWTWHRTRADRHAGTGRRDDPAGNWSARGGEHERADEEPADDHQDQDSEEDQHRPEVRTVVAGRTGWLGHGSLGSPQISPR